MKLKRLLLLSVFLPNILVAQITIDSSDFPIIGDQIVYQVNNLVNNLSPGDTGRAQVWDFRSFNRQTAEQFSVVTPSNAPFIDTFPSANLVFSSRQGSSFSYFQLTDTAFVALGSFIGSVGDENSLLTVNQNPKTELALPATFGSKYQSIAVNEQNLGDIGGGMFLLFVTSEVNSSEVDAYGTMRLEQGDFEVIRIKSTLDKVDSTFFETNGVRTFLNAINSTETNYDWYAKESRGPLVSFQSNAGAGGFLVSVLDTAASSFSGSQGLVEPPIAAFDTVKIGEGNYIFLDQSDRLPNTWLWNFGNGSLSNLQNPQYQFTDPGIYTVCLTVSNQAGSDSTCLTIDIPFKVPVTSFNYAQTNNGNVNFTNLTGGSVSEFSWDFGDGNTSTEESPTHQYLTEATYNVCLSATNVAGSDTTCQMITIDNLLPNAAFATTQNSVGNYQFTDNSTGTVDQRTWDFGDGTTSSLNNPVHQFTMEGSFNVCLVAENQLGKDTSCQTLLVENLFPDAAFTTTQEGIGQYTFEDQTAHNVTSWQWDFGDGNSSTEQNPNHQFVQEGDFNVCLIAGNEFGQDTTCQSFTITNLLPIAAFTQDSTGQGRFQFFNQSSDNSTNFSWDFGNDSTSTERNPSYQYAREGDYEVCLIAQNEFGRDTSCTQLKVQNIVPQAAFLVLAQEGDSISLMDTSTNLPNSWSWDFGDGNSATTQNPNHRYQASGLYQVCLAASNNFGTDTTCQELNIIVSDVLQASIDRELIVSPNPFQDYLQINWQGAMPKTILVFEIYNAQGQQMGLRQYLQASQSLPIGHWPTGSYWLQVKTQNGRLLQTFSLLKQ
ncbi:MAG: hypothetical protein Sapg2KO_31620 [Saprospiraceae bacterium]